MNENISLALVLLSMLTAWLLVWFLVVDYRNSQARNPIASHLLGAVIGFGAAFAAFCFFGALFFPNTNDSGTIAVGSLGAIIFSLYGLGYHTSKRTLLHKQHSPPREVFDFYEVPQQHAPYVAPIPPTPCKKKSHWLFPFAIGLWLGHTWGDDD